MSHYVIDESQLSELSLKVNDEKINLFQEIARKKNIMLCFGFVEAEDDKYYNSQILIDANGQILGVHRKRNLTRFESKIFTKGDTCVSTFEKNGFRIGVLICYDIFHKDFNESYSLRKPQLLLHSLADPLDPSFPTGYNGRKTNSIYISANRYGKEGRTEYTGHIAIVSASGNIEELKYGDENQIVKCLKIEVSSNITRDFFNTVSNTTLKTIHLVKHYKHIINFLKWDRKVKKERKNLSN